MNETAREKAATSTAYCMSRTRYRRLEMRAYRYEDVILDGCDAICTLHELVRLSGLCCDAKVPLRCEIALYIREA